ncbi:hypothetical protein C8R45DRAFT_834377 [Mycena sanguinolenta]|nr:hypothetical protein C8R45DRAFT_834377 [Mycena sanguinolenta]
MFVLTQFSGGKSAYPMCLGNIPKALRRGPSQNARTLQVLAIFPSWAKICR